MRLLACAVMVNSGLEGVVAATTRLSHVDGERGELVIAGFPVGELAAHATFEETTWLLWHGELPSARAARVVPRRAVVAARAAAGDHRACCASARAPAWIRWTRCGIAAGTDLAAVGRRGPRSWRSCPTIVAAYLAAAARRGAARARDRTWVMPRTFSTC